MPSQWYVPDASGLAAVMPAPKALAASVRRDVSTRTDVRTKTAALIHECRGPSPSSAARYSCASWLLVPRLRSASVVPTSWAAVSKFSRTSRRLATRDLRGRSYNC